MMVRNHPSTCAGCPLDELGAGFTDVEGDGSSGILVVAEASGRAEAQDSLPLRPYAESGSLFERACRTLQPKWGITRQSLAITNILRCQPPNNLLYNEGSGKPLPYTEGAIHHCTTTYLDQVVAQLKPRVILALGGTALRTLLAPGVWTKREPVPLMGREGFRGYIVPSKYPGVVMVATFHPAFMARGMKKYYGVFLHDFQTAIKVAKVGVMPDRVDYVESPTIQQAMDFYQWCEAYPFVPIAWDIESPRTKMGEDEIEIAFDTSQIESIQFSVGEGKGINFPWGGEWREIAIQVMALPNPKYGWNSWKYDTPLFEAHGGKVGGENHDLMMAWHSLHPEYERSLQSVGSFYASNLTGGPWKHTISDNFTRYGCVDADVTWRIGDPLFAALKDRRVWRSYDRHKRQLQPVLDRVGARGVSVDVSKHHQLGEELTRESAELDVQMQALYPRELRKVRAYTNLPKVVKDEYTRLGLPTKGQGLKDLHEGMGELREQGVDRILWEPEGELGPGVVFSISEVEFVTGLMWEKNGGDTYKWVEYAQFSALSSQQVLKYIKWRGYKVPHVFRSDKETTGKRELERLYEQTRDPLLGLIHAKRRVDKVKGGFVDGWKAGLGADGMLRTNYYLLTSTGQMSARDPNPQQIPKHGELAKRLRACIVARDGHTLVELDKRSFHAQTLAWWAKDKKYLRVAQQDVHSYVTARFLQNGLDKFGKDRLITGERFPNSTKEQLEIMEATSRSGELGEYLRDVDKWLSYSDSELQIRLAWIKERYKYIRDAQIKNCIAEGQLVLTDKGLVPIEKITLDHKVWDGVEWVNHQGVICQGEREVITYDGLTATPDHIVYLDSEEQVPFGRAASQLDRLKQTGLGGTAIRAGRNCLPGHTESSQRWVQRDVLQVCGLWNRELGELRQSYVGADVGVQTLCDTGESKVSLRRGVREQIRCDFTEVQQSRESKLSLLWGARNKMFVRVERSLYPVGGGESTPSYLSGYNNRSNRQRRSLRTGESTTSDTKGAMQQSEEYRLCKLGGGDNSANNLDGKIQPIFGARNGLQICNIRGANWGTNNRKGETGCSRTSEELGGVAEKVNRVRVYDILNVGPRHRFTVSGKLVVNCILGIGFGMGVEKLYEFYKEHFQSKEDAKFVRGIIEREFPNLFTFQQSQVDEAHAKGYLYSPTGSIREFWEAKKWNWIRGTWVNGEQAEQAKAFRPANVAHGQIKDEILTCEERGYNERYGLCLVIHDALIFHCPDSLVDECIRDVRGVMEAPDPIMDCPVMSPGGMRILCDISVGKNWASMSEVK